MMTPAVRDLVRLLAQHQWDDLDHRLRAIVRIGMTPIELVADLGAKIAPITVDRNIGREHAVALMGCAKRDGGMVV